MELWVRSQNKKSLVKVTNIHLDKTIGSDDYTIICDNFNVLGNYKTEERALEVLDEIEDLIKGKTLENHINKFDVYNSEKIKVYEMPKE